MNKKMLVIAILLVMTIAAGFVYAQSVTAGYFIPNRDDLDFMVYIGDFDGEYYPVSLHKRDGRTTWSGYGKMSGSNLNCSPSRGGGTHFSIRIINSRQINYQGYTCNSQYGQ